MFQFLGWQDEKVIQWHKSLKVWRRKVGSFSQREAEVKLYCLKYQNSLELKWKNTHFCSKYRFKKKNYSPKSFIAQNNFCVVIPCVVPQLLHWYAVLSPFRRKDKAIVRFIWRKKKQNTNQMILVLKPIPHMVAAFWKIWGKNKNQKTFHLMFVLTQSEENIHNMQWLLSFLDL